MLITDSNFLSSSIWVSEAVYLFKFACIFIFRVESRGLIFRADFIHMLHVPSGSPNRMLLHIDCETPFGDKCRCVKFSGLSGGCENTAWIIHALALNDLLTIIFLLEPICFIRHLCLFIEQQGQS